MLRSFITPWIHELDQESVDHAPVDHELLTLDLVLDFLDKFAGVALYLIALPLQFSLLPLIIFDLLLKFRYLRLQLSNMKQLLLAFLDFILHRVDLCAVLSELLFVLLSHFVTLFLFLLQGPL